MTKISFLDLSISTQEERNELLEAINSVLLHGRIILGPEVNMLENRLAKLCNRNYAVGVASGSDALYLALRALNIGQGDEVITTSLSWIASC